MKNLSIPFPLKFLKNHRDRLLFLLTDSFETLALYTAHFQMVLTILVRNKGVVNHQNYEFENALKPSSPTGLTSQNLFHEL